MNAFPLITILTAVPLIGALAVLGLGAQNKRFARGLALTFSFIALALTLILWHQFNPASGELQFEELHAWIPAIGVQYHLGIDGLGLLMLLLSAIVVPMSIAASWHIQERTPLYFSRTFPAGRIVRNVHGIEFFSLVHFLGTKPHSRVFLDSLVGRSATRFGSNPVLRLHDSWKRRVTARIPCDLSMHRRIRFHQAFRPGAQWTIDTCAGRQDRLAHVCASTVSSDSLLWSVSWLRREGTANSISHMAAFDLR